MHKAVPLAQNPGELNSIKDRLVAARQSSPLFDGVRFARDIEKAYRIMMQRYWSGEAPTAIEL